MSDKSLFDYLEKRLDRLETKVDTLINLEIEVGRLAGINEKVERLMKSHWIQAGAVGACSAIITTMITLYVGK